MAFEEGHFHCRIDYAKRGGKKLCARAKHDYNHRFGRWANKHEGPLAFAESGNIPAWADDPRTFWETADRLERANGTFYFNAELAIPVELSTLNQKRAVMREYREKLIGEKHPYSLTMHDNEGNPHCDLMWSTRTLDGIERSSPEHFFKQAMKDPARGGCKKAEYNREWIVAARKLWEEVCNKHLEAAGSNVRIDHRSYKDRGIEKAPGVHLGQKAHRLEKAGRKTVRGMLNKERSNMNAALAKVTEQITSLQPPPRKEKTHAQKRRTAKPQRAFAAWRDSEKNHPGLRSSRRAGPERMPVLRQHGVGTGQQEARDVVLPLAIPGFGSGNNSLHRLNRQGVNMEQQIEISNASEVSAQPKRPASIWEERRKQLNLALRTREDGQIDYMLSFTKAGKQIDYVACKFDGKDKIVAQGNHSESRAAAIAQAVLDRGWTKVNLTGSLEHQVAVARLLRQAGIEINEMSAEARAELERLDAEANGKSAENAVEQAKAEQIATATTTKAPSPKLDERDKLALRWLKTDAPVNAIEAAKLRKDPERLRQMFETHPEARRWELIQQQKAAGVPAALHGFKIDRDAKPQDMVGTVRHVGEQIWVQPQDRPNVVVPLPITANPPKPGQRIAVHGGEIARDHDNTPKPR